MIKLPRSKSKRTQILMSRIEPLEKGARARVHVIVEEQFDVEISYENVRTLIRNERNRAFTLT